MKTHLSLRVRDLKVSVEFYQAFFGASVHKLRPGYANFDLSDPPLKFALTQNPISCGAGSLDHLGFQVETAAQLETFKARLRAAGLATFDENDATCCYARQDKMWVHDPDGNEWEIYLLTDDLLDDTAHDHAGNALDESAMHAANETPPIIAPAHRCCNGS